MADDERQFEERARREARPLAEELLLKWQDGTLSDEQVRTTIEEWWPVALPFGTDEQGQRDRNDRDQIALEVLDGLERGWWSRKDAPVLLEFLDAPSGAERKAWEKYDAYAAKLDEEEPLRP